MAGTGAGTAGERLAPTVMTKALSTRITPLVNGNVSVITTCGVVPSGMVAVIWKVALSPIARSSMIGRNSVTPVAVSEEATTDLLSTTASMVTLALPAAV